MNITLLHSEITLSCGINNLALQRWTAQLVWITCCTEYQMLLTSTFKQIPLTCSKKLHKYISWLERLYPKTQSEEMCVLMEDEQLTDRILSIIHQFVVVWFPVSTETWYSCPVSGQIFCKSTSIKPAKSECRSYPFPPLAGGWWNRKSQRWQKVARKTTEQTTYSPSIFFTSLSQCKRWLLTKAKYPICKCSETYEQPPLRPQLQVLYKHLLTESA